jgi:hypothetical protein
MARTVAWERGTQVSICDAELYGKTVEGAGLQMYSSKEYYGGKLLDGKEALELIRKSEVVNLAGNNIVGEAIGAELASEVAVRRIGGTAFLLIFRLSV